MVSRYQRQELLPVIGVAGQERIRAARIVLIGCGALGTVMAEMLARAGIGHLRIIDRDIVELTNLQRQTLFTESDARNGVPKAIAAAERLRQINSEIAIEPLAVDVDAGNIESLLSFPNSPLPDLILDGTDNVETRYLINDMAVKQNTPWVYAAAVGTEGRVMGVMPSVTPCLRCMFPTPPAGAELATCDTSGVLAAATSVIASLAVVEGFKLLLGARPSYLLSADVWTGRLAQIDIRQRDEQCVCCGKRIFEFLNRPAAGDGAKLCGRNAVQIRGGRAVDLQAVALRCAALAEIRETPHMVRATLRDPAGVVLSVFPDGRVIVTGTSDVGRARSLAARFLGA
jgi:molybdopterin/thiamine biosynthesis adenylyltransferase